MSGLYYRGIINNIGNNQMKKVPEIPDFKLMVGTAEHLASMPVLVYSDYVNLIPEPLRKPLESMSHEEATEKLTNGTVSPNDFVGDVFWLGDAIGGVNYGY